MKISIVTATFNSEGTVADTLRSVSAQTRPDVEHLIIDGGSHDRTLDIVRAHQPAPARVVSEPDRGIYDAMNKGVTLASGEVIGILNSDDFYPTEDVLATVAQAFEADPELDVLYGDLCYVDQQQTTTIVRYWKSSPFQPGLFARGWCPPHPSLFVRRRVYQRCGGFDLRYPIAADMEFMARVLEVQRLRSRYIPQVMVHMRMGGTTNRSLRNIVQQNREIWQALKQHHLNPSLPTFVLSKLAAKSRQYMSRPQ